MAEIWPKLLTNSNSLIFFGQTRLKTDLILISSWPLIKWRPGPKLKFIYRPDLLEGFQTIQTESN